MKQDKEDKKVETKKEVEVEGVRKKYKEEENQEACDNKSKNTGYDTTMTGGYEKDPMEIKYEKMESAEEKMAAAGTIATKKKEALNQRKKKKKK